MDREVDSLDHLKTTLNDDSTSGAYRGGANNGEEPSYRIIPSGGNHASSFGAGGQISQVVDPTYRPPSVSINGNSTTAPSAITINFPNSNQFSQKLDVLIGNNQSNRTQTMPFSNNNNNTPMGGYNSSIPPSFRNNNNPTTSNNSSSYNNSNAPGFLCFSDLGQNNVSKQHPHLQQQQQQQQHPQQQHPQQHIGRSHHGTSNIMSSTLFEYGPVTINPPRLQTGTQPLAPMSGAPLPHLSGTQLPSNISGLPLAPLSGAPMPIISHVNATPATATRVTPIFPAQMRGPLNPAFGEKPIPEPMKVDSGPYKNSHLSVPNPWRPVPPPQASETEASPNEDWSEPGPGEDSFIPPTGRKAPPKTSFSSDRRIYSPPARAPSPPPDRTRGPSQPSRQVDRNQAPKVSGNRDVTSRSNDLQSSKAISTISGKIPKKGAAPYQAKLDQLTMLELQKDYRTCELKFRETKMRRDDIEKRLNNMTRTAQGRNIESDPSFRQLKDEQKQCDIDAANHNTMMKRITEKLEQKFNLKMTPSQPPVQSRRAKMSTASVTPTRSNSKDRSRQSSRERRDAEGINNKYRKCIFDLSTNRTWCQHCDMHFENLDEYCSHLHNSEHARNTRDQRKTTPWREPKDKIDQRRTYDAMKSICAKVNHEFDYFNMNDMDLILNPTLEDKDKVLKTRSINRERGTFTGDDPLFAIKGYDHIIPMLGFYCQLCNRAICDNIQVDEHLKSHEHNHAYAKSIALNAHHEKSFRSNLEKSYKRQYLDNEVDKSPKKNSKQPVAALPSTKVAANANSYKKSTSHIVDDHETIVDRFPKKVAQKTNQSTSGSHSSSTNALKKRRLISDDESDRDEIEIEKRSNERSREKSDRRRESPKKKAIESPRKSKSVSSKRSIELPEIVPLGPKGKQKPSALKRLKNKPSQEESGEDGDGGNTDNKVDTVEKGSKTARSRTLPPTISESDEGNISTLDQSQLQSGDPDSPFPNLDLCVTGHIHVSALKDKRLALPCKVIMNRINLEDYKDMLFTEDNLWERISRLMAKKEDAAEELIKERKRTEPVYFDVTGAAIPVTIENQEDEINDIEDAAAAATTDNQGSSRTDEARDRHRDRGESSFISSSQQENEARIQLEQERRIDLLTDMLSDSKEETEKVSEFSERPGLDHDKSPDKLCSLGFELSDGRASSSDDDFARSGEKKDGVDMSFLETFFCEK